MQFVRKYRRFFVAAAIFVLCLLVFYIFWHLQVAEARQKSRSLYLNDDQSAATAPLESGGVLSQRFSCEGPFHALGVVPVYGGSAAGTLTLTLYDDADNLLATVEGNAAETLSGSYAAFVFPQSISTKSGQYRLEFSAQTDAGAAAPALAKSQSAPAGWQLLENGEAAEGALCLMAATDRIGGFLTRFYWLFALLSAAFLGGLYLLFSFGVRPQRLFAAAAAGLCLLFCLILPPYAAPDEEYHINQTFTISSYFLGQGEYKPEWGTTVRRASDQNALIQDKMTTVFTYRELADNLFTTAADSTPTTYADEGVDGYRIPYWPVAAVVTLCRLLGLGFVPTLYIGRFASIALYVFLISMAVKLAPTGKSIFAAVGLLPMSLHLGASFSKDAVIIAVFVFYTALCLYYIIEKPRLDGRDLLLIAFLVLVVSRAKIIYAPIMLLFLLIPWQKFSWRGKALSRKWVLVLKAALVFLAFSHLYINLWLMLRMVVWEIEALLSAGAAGLVQASGVAASFAPAAAPSADSITFTIWDFFQNTGTIFWLVVRTFFSEFTFYIQSLVGGNLGYYNLPLSWGFVIALVLLLAVAVVPEPGSPLLRRNQRLFGFCATLGVLVFLVVGSILWTPTYYQTIYGLQGRYLLPVLPLLLCSASGLWGGLQKKREATRPLMLAFAGVGVFALLNAFLLILER